MTSLSLILGDRSGKCKCWEGRQIGPVLPLVLVQLSPRVGVLSRSGQSPLVCSARCCWPDRRTLWRLRVKPVDEFIYTQVVPHRLALVRTLSNQDAQLDVFEGELEQNDWEGKEEDTNESRTVLTLDCPGALALITFLLTKSFRAIELHRKIERKREISDIPPAPTHA